MKLVICDGPGSQSEKLEWASWTGVPVLSEAALSSFDDIEYGLTSQDFLLALEKSGNQRCVLVPLAQLSESQLAEYVHLWGDRVQFQWFNALSPQPEEK